MRLFLLFISTLCFHVFLGVAHASIVTIQALNFGEFVTIANDAQYDITVNTNGSYAFDAAGFIELSAPQEGVYDFGGLAPNTAIASVIITQTAPLVGIGPDINMVNLQETHSGSTDGSGVARIVLGGTARTDGSGILYVDQTLNGQLQIQINF